VLYSVLITRLLSRYVDHRALHSFPTRRSSDLVPVTIIGAFAAMYALGFSVNMLTLFGLILAIGIVVDDAIVVVENAVHHIERGRSEEHTSELQSRENLVCRLLLEKKK